MDQQETYIVAVRIGDHDQAQSCNNVWALLVSIVLDGRVYL